MNAKDIFEKLVERAMSLVWTTSSLRHKPGKPGEMIEKLSAEDREELQNLMSKDVKNIPHNHLAYMAADYPESTVTIHTHSIKKASDE